MKIYLLLISIFCLTNKNFSQSGCTDHKATNYNSSATTNDGSCTYASTNVALTDAKTMPSDVHESSSLIYTDGGLWTLNDSGNDPQIFKIDPSNGDILKTVNITNADNVDWEGVSADANYFYIGDFGNNKTGDRTDLKVYRVLKSDIGSGSDVNVTAEEINFSYPDQTIDGPSDKDDTKFDCESMLIKNNKIHLFSKNWVEGRTQHYSIPTTPGTYVATKLDEFNSNGLITDASIGPNGEIVLLGYTTNLTNSFMWLLYDYNGENFFSGNKRRFELGSTLSYGQTEGIALTSNGDGYVSNEELGPIDQSIYSFSIESFVTLPVNLTAFKATYVNPDVKLEWQTSAEVNSDYFSVQRSVDGVHFNEIGRKASAKNSSEVQNYSFVDEQPFAGVNYYRLVQVDLDGTPTSYSTRLVNVPNQGAALRVYVSASQLMIDAGRAFNRPQAYQLINTSGALLKKGILTSARASIDISGLPKGGYYVHVAGETVKFVK